jgi:predicted GNAT family N-acyltransferase
MEVKEALWPRDHEAIAAIRRRVFIEEQKVPEALEWDGLDEQATHLLAWENGEPVGTTRMLADGHIGRMAVLKAFRGRGIGRQLLEQMLRIAIQKGMAEVELDAQVHAMEFYERLGFSAEGGVFMDAGIPHRHMRKPL